MRVMVSTKKQLCVYPISFVAKAASLCTVRGKIKILFLWTRFLLSSGKRLKNLFKLKDITYSEASSRAKHPTDCTFSNSLNMAISSSSIGTRLRPRANHQTPGMTMPWSSTRTTWWSLEEGDCVRRMLSWRASTSLSSTSCPGSG